MSAGADMRTFSALQAACKSEGAMLEVIAPVAGEVRTSDGSRVQVNQKVEGGPSVLYDAVVVLAGKDSATELSSNPAAQNFVKDAYDHQKFIAYVDAASPLLERAGISSALDQGCMNLTTEDAAREFIATCRQLRYWQRGQAMSEKP